MRVIVMLLALAALAGCRDEAGSGSPATEGTSAATATASGTSPMTEPATPAVWVTVAVETTAGAVVTTAIAQSADAVIQLPLVDSTRPTAAANGAAGSTSRILPTTVYLPASPAPAPLIVLAHGAGGEPEKFTDLASAWAAAGYVVAVPRFPLSNSSVVPPVLDFEAQGGDVAFVIESVLAASAGSDVQLAGRIDADRIGLFGLSLGSISVWRAVLGRTGVDAQVDALIQSDGLGYYDSEQNGKIAFPVMIVHSDVDAVFDYALARTQFDALSGPAFLLTLHGAAHAAVAENTVTPADAAMQNATTVFWNRFLLGRTGETFRPGVEVAGVTSFEVGA